MKVEVVVFDWKRTLYDPDEQVLIDGALHVLEHVKKISVPMYLIGKGGEDMYDEVQRLRVAEFFTKIVFREGAKDEDLFKPYITEDSARTIFLGDRIRSELAAGKSLGATTIWVRQGKFADEAPENSSQVPDFTVTSLLEAQGVLTQMVYRG